jgi:hypothetical protein
MRNHRLVLVPPDAGTLETIGDLCTENIAIVLRSQLDATTLEDRLEHMSEQSESPALGLRRLREQIEGGHGEHLHVGRSAQLLHVIHQLSAVLRPQQGRRDDQIGHLPTHDLDRRRHRVGHQQLRLDVLANEHRQ